MHICIYTYIHIYIHRHTHIYIYTQYHTPHHTTPQGGAGQYYDRPHDHGRGWRGVGTLDYIYIYLLLPQECIQQWGVPLINLYVLPAMFQSDGFRLVWSTLYLQYVAKLFCCSCKSPICLKSRGLQHAGLIISGKALLSHHQGA